MSTQPIYCINCSKPIKGEPRLVHMTTGNRLYLEQHWPEATPEHDDQGSFEIGPDCYRKVAKAGAAGYQL